MARRRIDPRILIGLRRQLGMTQEDLARELDASTRTIQRWEAGQVTPTPVFRRLLRKLAADASINISGF